MLHGEIFRWDTHVEFFVQKSHEPNHANGIDDAVTQQVLRISHFLTVK